MILGFHTISLLLHDEFTAVTQLAQLGYQCAAIRPRLGGLNPGDDRFLEMLLRFSNVAQASAMQVVVDVEGEFIHDPQKARGPSLASADVTAATVAQRSIQTWIEVAGDLGCQLITFSSGKPTGEESEEADLERLSARIETLLEQANPKVKLAVRPAAGDVIATVAQFERFKQWLSEDANLWLAADVGEMLVGGEFPVGDRLGRNLNDLACVYLCEPGLDRSQDRRVGQGDIDLSRVIRSLEAHGFHGPAIVRVQGHSELGLTIAAEAIEFLQRPEA